MKPKARKLFLKIASAFYKFLDIKPGVIDIVITGSNANYNWTSHSDIDLHLIINYALVSENMKLVRDYMMAKKALWNAKYPIMVKGMQVELYAQDENEPHTASGIYSLARDAWLETPNQEYIEIEDSVIEKKAAPYKFEIDRLKPTTPGLLDKVNNIKKKLKHLRQTGLEAAGEFSIENMAFKELRNSGYLRRLVNLEKDSMMSMLDYERLE